MDFKYARDFGKGKRVLMMGIDNETLEKMPASLRDRLLQAEASENPIRIVRAWADLMDPTLSIFGSSGPGRI